MNRKDIVLNNSTHKTKCEYSYMIISQNKKQTLLILNKQGKSLNNQQINQAQHAIIIENFDNFCDYENFFHNIGFDINKCEYQKERVDVIFGAGKQITNSNNYNFLKNYKTIMVFGDYDEGGFSIYKSLKSNIKTYIQNYYPQSIEDFLKISYNLKVHGFKNINKYIMENNNWLTKEDINTLNLLNKYNKGIEQELFLNNNDNLFNKEDNNK